MKEKYLTKVLAENVCYQALLREVALLENHIETLQEQLCRKIDVMVTARREFRDKITEALDHRTEEDIDTLKDVNFTWPAY